MIALALAAAILNPDVTPENIHQTICLPHYAAAYRRAHPVKVKPKRGYVRDHKIPLSLGGSSDDSNIQYQTREESIWKDRAERELHADVCDGWLHLKNAQRQILEWKP